MKMKDYKNHTKICCSCGRTIEYRDAILSLLNERGPLKTICPSEVLPPDLKQDKIMMEHVRRSARLLAAEDKIEITQLGKVVDPTSFKGPIRLKLK
jgi:hypothetical protein